MLKRLGLFLLCAIGLLPQFATAESIAGRWSTDWGEARVFQTGESIYGTYDEDHGRFRIDRTAQGLIGVWAESEADQECTSHRLGSRYWGYLELKSAPSLKGFTINWGYCEHGTPDRTWEFAKKLEGEDVITRFTNGVYNRIGVAGPTPSGQAMIQQSIEDVVVYEAGLRRMDFSESDLSVLEKRIAPGKDPVTLQQSLEFALLAFDLEIATYHSKQRKHGIQLAGTLGLGPGPGQFLDKEFHLSDRLMNPDVAPAYGYDFMRFVIHAAQGKYPKFDKKFPAAKNAETVRVMREAEGLNSIGPSIQAAGQRNHASDCSFHATLERLILSDPKFKVSWRTHTGYGGVLNPGGMSFYFSKGANIKRRQLIAQVRLEMAKCEKG